MADPEIPETLLTAQLAYDEAEKELAEEVAAGAAGEKLAELRTAARTAVVALHQARTEAGPDWASWAGTQKIQEAARGE